MFEEIIVSDEEVIEVLKASWECQITVTNDGQPQWARPLESNPHLCTLVEGFEDTILHLWADMYLELGSLLSSCSSKLRYLKPTDKGRQTLVDYFEAIEG